LTECPVAFNAHNRRISAAWAAVNRGRISQLTPTTWQVALPSGALEVSE
jgi:hypothetical protein